tara:strand:- start:802 stop:1155 length:354 start_codon:yes stop_codon:yes gene_type:complete
MSGIPSGNGTEVIKVKALTSQNASWVDLLGGSDTVANHIYILLSLTINNPHGSSDERFSMKVVGNNAASLLEQHGLPHESTFTWKEKTAIIGTDDLQVWNNVTTLHYYLTYIDQDWS